MCVCVSHVNPLFGESVGIYWEVVVVFLFCLQEADPTVVLPFLPLIRLSTISHQSDRMWLVQYSYWQSHFTMFRDDLLVAPIKSTPVDCQNPINYPWLKSYFPIKNPHYILVQHHGDLRWRHVWLWSRRPRMAGNLVLCSFFGRGPWKSCMVY